MVKTCQDIHDMGVNVATKEGLTNSMDKDMTEPLVVNDRNFDG